MSAALICLGPGHYALIDINDATPDQRELAITNHTELALVQALVREPKEELTDELE